MKVTYEFDEEDRFARACFESGVELYDTLEQISGVVREARRDLQDGNENEIDAEEILEELTEMLTESVFYAIK